MATSARKSAALARRMDRALSPIDEALELVTDTTQPAEDRVALYAILFAIQRDIRRSLGVGVRSAATPQAELVSYLEANGLRGMGPVQVKATAYDVTWPVNSVDNWQDSGLQSELAAFALIAPDYIRLVPEHYELDTAAMAHGIANGDPVAVKLQRHAASSGWRREGGRRLSLAVREATR